jgi:hypothetical protein
VTDHHVATLRAALGFLQLPPRVLKLALQTDAVRARPRLR